MTLSQAIQDAVRGGYITGFVYERLAKIDSLGAFEILLLDPAWWRALGKERGWKEVYEYTYHDSFGSETPIEYPEWLNKMHNFIDHLASGRDITSFFEELV